MARRQERLTSIKTEDTLMVDEIGLSVVIPAYNEVEAVGSVVESVLAELETTEWKTELIVVDDGSTDGTADVADCFGVRVIRHKTNRGYGAAIKTGIRRARYPLVCIIDADGTYANEDIPRLVRCLVENDSDMVVGARVGPNVAIPMVRRPAKWVIGRLAELAAGVRIPDLNSGLRVFKRDVVVRFLSLLPDSFSLTTTVTLALLGNGYVVNYVSSDYRVRRGRSKIRPIRDTLNFVGLILRIALYFAPLRVFLPASAFLFLIAIAWAIVSWSVLDRLADVSTVIIVMVAIQVAVMGLLAEMINRRLPNYFEDGG